MTAIHDVRWLLRLLLLGVATGGLAWAWVYGPAREEGWRAQVAVQTLELALAQPADQHHDARVSVGQGPAQAGRAPKSPPDLQALVQWQALLRQHQLSGWQGRLVSAPLVPAASVPSPGVADGAGLWRLEGPATYAQGLAVLLALVREMPEVVIHQVQVRQGQDASSLLHWLLELQWSAMTPTPRWSSRWPTVQGPVPDPFAAERLGPNQGMAREGPTTSPAQGHAWAHVPVRELRLAGILSDPDGHRALVTSESSREASSVPGHSAAMPALNWQTLRLGQIVGKEQVRVMAIEPRRVVLAGATRAGASGAKESAAPVVLELASMSPGLATSPVQEQERP
jgi:hypothetical protein